MDPKTKSEARALIVSTEQHARLCERAARKACGFPALAAEKRRAAHEARQKAVRLRALLPTLSE